MTLETPTRSRLRPLTAAVAGMMTDGENRRSLQVFPFTCIRIETYDMKEDFSRKRSVERCEEGGDRGEEGGSWRQQWSHETRQEQ